MPVRARSLFLSAIVVLSLNAGVLAACSDSGSSGGTGSDKEYVKGICLAGGHFIDRLMKGFDTPTGTATASLDDFGNAFASIFLNLTPAYETLAKEFKALKPPKDLADWHKDAVAKMDAAVKALKAGNFDDPAVQDLGGDAMPAMPKDAQDRLQKIAEDTKECKDLEAKGNSDGGTTSIFGGLIGGGDATETPTPGKR